MDGIIAFWPIPGGPWGGSVPPSPVLAPEWASCRIPALPYPPLRSRHRTSLDCGRAIPCSSALARLSGAMAFASPSFRADQMASARPAGLSAGVT